MAIFYSNDFRYFSQHYIFPLSQNHRTKKASRNSSYLPNLKRIRDPDPRMSLHCYAHHLMPRLPQTRSAISIAARFQLSRYTATQPLPANDATQLAGARIDPMHRLPRAKMAHQTNLHRIHVRYDTFVNDRNYKKAMRKYALEPDVQLNTIREYAEEMARDPDKYFDGSTADWYCSGSAMALVHNANGVDWLAHVQDDGGLFNLLRKCAHVLLHSMTMYQVNPISKTLAELSELRVQADGSVRLNPCPHFQPITAALADHGHIYEVLTSSNRLLCVRQKTHITIVDPHSGRIVTSSHSEVPYISASFDAERLHFIAVDVQRQLSVWPLDAQRTEPVQSVRLGDAGYQSVHIADPWTAVRPLAAHMQVIADRESVHVFDTRVPYDALLQPHYAHTFRPYMDRCEMLTCVELLPGVAETCVLAGASHRLFALDLRMLADSDGDAAADGSRAADLVQWAHQLQSRPAMLSALRPTNSAPHNSSDTLIAVAAHAPGDMRLIEMQQIDGIRSYAAQTMPYRPPAMSDGHQLVRRMGACLAACSRLPQQMRASVAGMRLWECQAAGKAAGTLHLLHQSSAGDVFAQQLVRRDAQASTTEPDNARMRTAFQTWDEQLERLATRAESAATDAAGERAAAGRPHVATDQTYFRGLADVLAQNVCNPYGIGLTAETAKTAAAAAGDGITLERRDPWRQPLRKLRTYVDALAPSMLEIWQMPVDVVDSETAVSTQAPADVSVIDKAAIGVPSSVVAPAMATRAARISAWVNRSSTQTDAAAAAAAAPSGKAAPFDTTMSTIAATQATQDYDWPETGPPASPDRIAEAKERNRIDMLEATLTDAAQLMQETMAAASSRQEKKRHGKMKKKRKRAFVLGF